MRQSATAAIVLAALTLTAQDASAQQNLFNVPSGKITDLGDMFFQQQFNFSRPVGSSNTTFDFGLGKGWELGFNALDLNMYEVGSPDPFARHQVNPDLLLNAQKGFDLIEDRWNFSIGTQMGINPTRYSREVRYQAFTWAINEFELPEDRAKLYAGIYYANVAYAGPGGNIGGLFGVEIPVIKDKFHFQADYITGQRDISVGVLGGVFMLPYHTQLSIGAQVPAFRSNNPYGIVIEFTVPGFPLRGRSHGN